MATESVESTIEHLVDELYKYSTNHEGFGKLWSEADEELKKLCQHPSYGPRLTASLKVLKSAVVSGSWTALECVAADCWVTALNQSPTPLAHRAIASIPQESDVSEISSKLISVGLAAKYNFDLRNCLGTVLKPKFDFTSVGGMKKAYSAAFKGSSQADELQVILSKPVLRELEVTRNLIVHRAGMVDEEYKKQLSIDLPLGQPLELTDNKIRTLAEESAVAAAAVLIFVDDWLGSQD